MIKRRHKLSELVHNFVAFVSVGEDMELIKLLEQNFAVNINLVADENLFISGLFESFFVHQQLLIELFARAKSRELDLDILVRHLAVHTDEVLGEGDNLDGLAHIEHKYLAAVRDSARLEHK